jgi:ABC-type transporter lipoprotein component MlaA
MNWYFVALCLVIIVLLGRHIYRRARELQQRVEEFHKEQEQNPIDPYSALSELYKRQRSFTTETQRKTKDTK